MQKHLTQRKLQRIKTDHMGKLEELLESMYSVHRLWNLFSIQLKGATDGATPLGFHLLRKYVNSLNWHFSPCELSSPGWIIYHMKEVSSALPAVKKTQSDSFALRRFKVAIKQNVCTSGLSLSKTATAVT